MNREKSSRRSFLKQSALIAGGALISPTILPSCVRKDSPNGKVNIAHIGVGGQGKGLISRFLPLHQEVRVVAVCDPFRNRREEVKASVNGYYAKLNDSVGYKGCDDYNDFRELLAREDIDGVVIAVPDHWHVPIAAAAVKAGKDVYLEKPLGLTIEQGQKLRKLVRDNKAIFQYGTQQRSDPQFRQACEIVRNGFIGKLERMDVWCETNKNPVKECSKSAVPDGFDYDLWLGPAPVEDYCPERVSNLGAWFIYDYSLGFIAGWGAHPLDIAQWGNNSDDTCPVKISGRGTFKPDYLHDTINSWDLKCEYQDGVVMDFMSPDVAMGRVDYREFLDHGTTFFGKEGWVSVDRRGIHASNPEWLKYQFGEDDLRLYHSTNHYKNFIDGIKTRKDPICTIEAAVQSDAISHLSDVLIRSGENEINWDPRKEAVINPTSGMEKLMQRDLRSPWII